MIFFATQNIFAQNQITEILQKKDFISFKNYLESLSKEDKNIKTYWEILRDIAPEYKEGIAEIQFIYPDKNDESRALSKTFKAYIITFKRKSIYYYFVKENPRDIENKNYQKIDTYIDKNNTTKLNNKFKSIFGDDFKVEDLFDTSLVYGKKCGGVGIDPIGKTQIDEWISNNNKNEILEWLKSANAEKQIYAIDGLFQLKQKGVQISEDEVKIIDYIKTKEGKISTCSGCIYSSKEIKEITKNFHF